MTGSTQQPSSVRQLDTPAAHALADLASILDDLQTVLRCCERLLAELANDTGGADDLLLEAIWTTALLSYSRCFSAGRRGMGLTEDDVTATSLQGEVLEWHKVLRQLRKHFADPTDNPRERFSVGAAQDSGGRANAIAITSTPHATLDDRTVQQTGALAYELAKLVDQRIAEQQERLLTAARSMTKSDLEALPLIDIADASAPETDPPA